MIHLVTFCADNMTRAASLCLESAKAHGADTTLCWSQQEILERASEWTPFEHPENIKGVGWWAWKPFIIREMMNSVSDGEIVVYIDAGVKLIDSLHHIINRMDQDIWLFGNEWPHEMWCKRDIVEIIWPRDNDDLWRHFGKQAQASVILFRVSDRTRLFVQEWLGWCLFQDGRLVDDSPSREPNHPDFRENRYDQAILTTMAYREGIKLHGWFVRYPTFEPRRTDGYESDTYPTLFVHHRWRNHEWQEGVLA